MSIKIIIVDDHDIVRKGVRALLERHPDFIVIGEAADGVSAIQMVKEVSPDIVIMDVGMSNINGIEATRQIIRQKSSAKVIALSMHTDKHSVVQMFKAGALGYLLKDCAFEEIITAIHHVMNNKIYLSPMLGGSAGEDVPPYASRDTVSSLSPLTVKEREVLYFLSEGKTTKEIARVLGVSIKTIETHRCNIMHKLDIHSIAGLTRYAINQGITSL